MKKLFKKLNIGKWLRRTRLSNKLYYYTIIVVIFAVFGSTALWQLTHPHGSDAAWFDENYLYRQVANITNSNSTALTDFQVALTVDTATLISAGKMRRDCNDIRITDQGGNLLPFWVEEGSADCNSSSTKIWTKAPSIATSGASLFFYYGNQQAASASSGLTTFDFFDDFNKGQLDNSKWAATGATSYSGGNLNITTGSVYTQNPVASQPNQKVEARTQWTNNLGVWGGVQLANAQSTQAGNAGSNKVLYYMRSSNTLDVVGYAANGSAASYNIVSGQTQFTSVTGTSYILSQDISSTNVTFYKDRVQTNTTVGTWSAPYYLFLGYHLGAASGVTDIQDISVDWVLSRKYAATEPTVSFGSEEQSPSPAAYWAFDEGTGNVSSSSASLSVPASLFRTTWQPENQCVAGKCLYYDVSTKAFARFVPTNVLQTSAGSVSIWFRPTGTQGNASANYIFSHPQTADNSRVYISVNQAGTSVTGMLGNGAVIATSTITVDQWHHAVLTWSGTTAAFYIDGKNVTTTSTFNGLTSITTTAYIGALNSAGSQSFNGYIDEAKVYNFLLSAAQVKANFNARGGIIGQAAVLGATQNSVLSNGLVGYWKMDEASWNGTASEVIDSSGNSNNGTSVSGANASPSAKFGNAGYFAGIDEYVSVTPSFRGTLTSFTVGQWVYMNSLNGTTSNQYSLFFNLNGQSLYPRGYVKGDGVVTLQLKTGGVTQALNTSAGAVTAGKWYHIVYTFRSSDNYSAIYVDGTLKVSTTFSSGTLDGSTSGAMFLGFDSNLSIDLNGNLDETRIYNRAMNPMEVAQLYNFAPGPVGYWDFEEGQGSVVNDTSTYGNNGAWAGTGSKWTSGKFGKGGSFNGVDDGVQVTNSSSLNPAFISVSAWIKSGSSVSDMQIASKDCTSFTCPPSLRVWQFKKSANVLTFIVFNQAGSNNTAAGTTIIADSKWHFVEGTWDGATIKVYVDGKLEGSQAFAGTSLQTGQTNDFFIGRSQNSGGGYWSGQIDQVRVYNYAQTPGQIVSDMNAGAPGVTASGKNTLGYWKFDDGYGTVASNSGILGASANGLLYGFANPATAVSGWSKDGRYGGSLQFNATPTVRVSDNNALDFGPYQDFSYSLWIKRTSSSTSTFPLAKGAGGTSDEGYSFVLLGGRTPLLELSQNVESSRLIITAGQQVPDTGWHHLAFIYDRDGMGTIYMDGKVIGQGDISSYADADLSNSKMFTIGAGSGFLSGSAFDGGIDEVKLYNYPLTAQDVKTEYNHGSSLVLGSAGMNSSGVASNSAGAYYCVPGDTSQSCSPVGEWKFEEGQGSTVNDTSGNGFSGTLTNTPVWARGKVGGALDFTATTPYVSFGANKIGPKASGASAVTMSAWVYATGYPTARGRIFSAYDATNTTGFALSYNTTNIEVGGRAALADAFLNTTVAAPALNGWHYLTGILDFANNKIYIYIDGALAKTATVAFGSTTYVQGTSTTVDVINLPPGEHLAAFIDQVRVYDYARSQAQIAYEYNQGKPVAYYDFDECEGSTAHEYYNSTGSGTIQIGPSGTQTTVGTCQAVNTAAAWYNGVAGKFNYSLNFDGTDDFVTMPSGAFSLNDNFTLSAWIKPTTDANANYNIIGSTAYSTNNSDWYFHRQRSGLGNHLSVLKLNGNQITSTGTLTADSWWHVVFTLTNGSAKLYINGVLDTTSASFGAIATGNKGLVIGRRGDATSYFAGQIDDAQVFNYALTPVQIRGVYNQNSAVRFGPSTGAP